MVVPAAVQEVGTAIDGPAHDADGVGGVVRNSQVIAADTYDRYLLARPAELAVRHLVVHVHALAVDPSKESKRDTDVLTFTVRGRVTGTGHRRRIDHAPTARSPATAASPPTGAA